MNLKRSAKGIGIVSTLIGMILGVNALFELNQHTYFPLFFKSEYKLHQRCAEIWRGQGPGKIQQIKDLDLWCVRYNWGTETKGGIWQEYKTNGWTNLDQSFKTDIEAIRSAEAVPIIVIHPNKADQTCRPVEDTTGFIQFTLSLIDRYQIKWVDLGNEVDAKGGIPGLFGCHGDAQAFTALWKQVKRAIASDVKLGMSFMMDTDKKHPFINYVLARTNPGFVGIHDYVYYPGADRTLAGGISAYPGGLDGKLEWISQRTNSTIWITEANLICPNCVCTDHFKEMQAEHIATLREYKTAVVIYSLTNYPGWACAALNPGSPSWDEWSYP